MKRDFKGVWIVKEIWENKDLTWMEKLFFVEIDSLDNENNCFASNKYFADFFNLSISRVSQIINELKNKGFIDISYIREGRQIKKRVLSILKGGIQYSKGGYLENAKDNNTNINNTNIKEGFNEKPNHQLNEEPKIEKPFKEEKEKKSLTISKKEKEALIQFDFFWKEYHKTTGKLKTDKESAIKYWIKLSLNERRMAYSNIKNFYNSIKNKNDKEYIKKAYTYLRDKIFNNEFKKEEANPEIPKHHYDPNNDPSNIPVN
jgi:hypothetical protein